MGRIGIFPFKRSYALSDQWERSGSRKYIAAFTPDCDEVYVGRNLGFGFSINDPHPSDPGQVVAGVTVEGGEEPSQFLDPTPITGPSNAANGTPCYWWTVGVNYGPWDPLTHTATGNPADQPVDISFQWQVFEQAVDFAYTPGTTTLVPVLNSAGDPFDPPVTREQLKGVMRVSWNSLTFNPVPFFQFGNYINSDVWNGFPAYTIKFSPPNMPQRLYSQFLGRNYYRLEGEFCFNPNDGGWNAKPIDRGFRALNGSGVPYKIFDVNGQPISQPALLNGSGVPLTSVAGTGFYQWNYQVYLSTAFATAFPNLTNLFM